MSASVLSATGQQQQLGSRHTWKSAWEWEEQRQGQEKFRIVKIDVEGDCGEEPEEESEILPFKMYQGYLFCSSCRRIGRENATNECSAF